MGLLLVLRLQWLHFYLLLQVTISLLGSEYIYTKLNLSPRLLLGVCSFILTFYWSNGSPFRLESPEDH